METLETHRLVGRPPRVEDGTDFRRLLAGPEVAAWLSAEGAPFPAESADAALGRFIDHHRREGFGPWVFRDRSDGGFLGYCGLRRVHVAGADETELLYAFLSGHWGRGLASEAARACLEARPPGLSSVVAFTLPNNLASRRVMEKTGFVFEKPITHAGLPHVLYRLGLRPL